MKKNRTRTGKKPKTPLSPARVERLREHCARIRAIAKAKRDAAKGEALNGHSVTEPETINRRELLTVKELVFFHTGDLGDIIAFLPTLRHMGGGHIVIGEREHTGGPGYCRESMRGLRYEVIKPLLEAQPYVHSVSWGDCAKDALDVSTFRHTTPIIGENLALWQARHLGVTGISLEPWLTVPEKIEQPAIFARSPRFHNPRFPWHDYARHYPAAVFVGSVDEHIAFQIAIGRKIEHRITPNLLFLAQLMAGSPQVLSNQTCAWWIAAGVGAPTVQETCPRPLEQNSMIQRARLKYSIA